jgi:hypothetical protein
MATGRRLHLKELKELKLIAEPPKQPNHNHKPGDRKISPLFEMWKKTQ